MKEDFHIEAFEIIERNVDFEDLSAREKEIIIQAFGSETAYKRMRGVTSLALEEDPIIAPSMTTESDLLKEFRAKHDTSESKSIGNWSYLLNIFKLPLIRYAIPVFVLIFGLIWFLNQTFVEQHETDQMVLSEEHKINPESEEGIIEEPSDADVNLQNGLSNASNNDLSTREQTNEVLNSSSDIDVTSELIEDMEFAEEEQYVPSESLYKEESSKNLKNVEQVNKERSENKYFQVETEKDDLVVVEDEYEKAVLDGSNSSDDEEIIDSEPSSAIIYTDDAMGNTAEIQEITVFTESSSRNKKPAFGDKYSVSPSQSGINDKSLHQFLYATY